MSTVGLDNVLATQSAANAASTASASTAASGAKAVKSEKDMFLNLLVKQLQYQDPLNPVENTEFASQLAQFSSLEALTSVKESMDSMSKVQNSMNSMQAVSFIGKKVNASGNTIDYTGEKSSINFKLESDALDAVVAIYNSSGNSVRTLDMKNVKAGDATCTWDGKDDSGKTLGSGTYYFKINATDYSGNAVTAIASTDGTVSGVRYDNGTVYLEVGDKEVSLADVTHISN
jgi:flagellar basal-body rod modification protein FlgD